MVESGQLAGVYNLVIADTHDLFDHRVPVEEFDSLLEERNVPEKICVVGLGDFFDDDEAVSSLRRQMDDAADRLENRSPLPTIQFAVEGSFQRRSRDFELKADEDLYRLSRVFGPQIQRRDNDWLTAPF